MKTITMKQIKHLHEDRLKLLDDAIGFLGTYENETEDEEHVVYKAGTKELHPEKTKKLFNDLEN